jgi:predicted nucleic acid-binding protein
MKKPVVFLDSDVIFAGAASPTEYSASHVVLILGEITLIECLTSSQVVTEVERNLEAKLPAKLPELRLILSRSLHVVPNPLPEDLPSYKGHTDPKDLPILVAAIQHDCRYLLTFNLRHYSPPPDRISVITPGDFIRNLRDLLTRLEE